MSFSKAETNHPGGWSSLGITVHTYRTLLFSDEIESRPSPRAGEGEAWSSAIHLGPPLLCTCISCIDNEIKRWNCFKNFTW